MSNPESIAPGVWRYRFGQPEAISPITMRRSVIARDRMDNLPASKGCPFQSEDLRFQTGTRGCVLKVPFDSEEGIFGLGLQFKSHLQSGKKKLLRVNSDPIADTGDSHAPAPFYVSTKGYGVMLDTARYVSVYTGTHLPAQSLRERSEQRANTQPGLSTEEIYRLHAFGKEVIFDIPSAAGVDIYFFEGPETLDAIRRYTLFSGGGCLPPVWGLKNWYRPFAKHAEEDIYTLIESFAKDGLPFEVIGLEPGWQTKSYPNSLVWSERFPDPAKFIRNLQSQSYKLNLWEHAFLDPTCPIAEEIAPHCADVLGMDGLVPDFYQSEGERLFAKEHEHFIKQGVSGFKLDECDNSDFISYSWSFPEFASFPCGADGEQMHSLYGLAYQSTVDRIFRKKGIRHYSLARSSGALAAPFPFALYSDLYAHDDFLRGVVNAGFCGLLYAPEVRHAVSIEDLIRRLQTAVLSPLSIVNCWYMPNTPWFQINRQLNQEGIAMAESSEAVKLVREVLELRMRLLPVLYTAFAHYYWQGVPPFRALVADTPEDRKTWLCDQQYLIGKSLLAAPLKAGESEKKVYLPEGGWRNFFTGEYHKGGDTITITNPQLGDIPLFVRDGTILPLAEVRGSWKEAPALPVKAHVYGENAAKGELYEDDGASFAFEEGQFSWMNLTWTPQEGLRCEGKALESLFILDTENPIHHQP